MSVIHLCVKGGGGIRLIDISIMIINTQKNWEEKCVVLALTSMALGVYATIMTSIMIIKINPKLLAHESDFILFSIDSGTEIITK